MTKTEHNPAQRARDTTWPNMSWRLRACDVGSSGIVIVGGGLAGLYTALKLAPLPVTVIAAAPLGQGASSNWAQGGIAAAVGTGDTTSQHAIDTISAGGGLVDDSIAHLVASEAPNRIRDLLRYGVPFDHDLAGKLVLSKEAAHSEARVVRVTGDQAGAAIMAAIIAQVRKTPSIRLVENATVDELLTSDGRITGLRLKRTAGVTPTGTTIALREELSASAVVIATGGIGALYAHSTNPPYALGQALAFAARAGAAIRDAEFVQFHPTALDVGLDPAPLASEVLRGEGAILVNDRGERFMDGVHPDMDMAPRDIVAGAVYSQIHEGRSTYLDCRKAIGEEFETKFPTAWAHCQRAGINPRTDLIPITPAAHYHMGGIATDKDARTTLSGLWAVGEAAASGLHGANRLASNSLLEAVVMANRAATDIISNAQQADISCAFPIATPRAIDTNANTSDASTNPLQVETALADEIKKIMSAGAGVVRTEFGLRKAIRRLRAIERRAGTNDGSPSATADMALAARVIATAALLRQNSVGAHIRADSNASSLPGGTPSTPESSRFLTLSDIDAVRVPLRSADHLPAPNASHETAAA